MVRFKKLTPKIYVFFWFQEFISSFTVQANVSGCMNLKNQHKVVTVHKIKLSIPYIDT